MSDKKHNKPEPVRGHTDLSTMIDDVKINQQTLPGVEYVKLVNNSKQLLSFELHDKETGTKKDCHLAGGSHVRVVRGADLGPDVQRLIRAKTLSFRSL